MFRKFKERLRQVKEVQKIRRDSENLELNYETSKNTFKYFSDSKLQAELKQIKSTKPVDFMKMMAAEEVLIERGVIDHSVAHEHLNDLRKGTPHPTDDIPKKKEVVIIFNPRD